MLSSQSIMTCSLVKKKIALILTLIALCSTSYAQAPQETPQAFPQASPAETTRPLYGLQGVLIENLACTVVSSQAENEQFNPASTMKLATALVALRTLG